MTDIGKIISEIAKQEKLHLVFEKNRLPVLYAADGPNLTQQVLKKYDAQHGK